MECRRQPRQHQFLRQRPHESPSRRRSHETFQLERVRRAKTILVRRAHTPRRTGHRVSATPPGTVTLENPSAQNSRKYSRVMLAVWIAMPICWLIQAYTSRHTLIAADGISYLEIAYGVLAGNWHALLNTYWSPGYPLVLAAFLKLFNPRPQYELPLMRLVGWLTLVACLGAFEYFVCAFLRFRQSLESASGAQEEPLLPAREFRVLAYALFFWCTTVLVPSSNEHPDILVLLIYLLASAVAMDLLTARRGYARYILFG